MDSILQQITDWLKEMLVSAIMGNLSGMFESVNNQVGEIATSVGMTPANFSPGVFAMVRNISESVIIPIAGLILTFIACYELIQMIIDHNNLANFETWIFFKWVFKTFVAVMLRIPLRQRLLHLRVQARQRAKQLREPRTSQKE